MEGFGGAGLGALGLGVLGCRVRIINDLLCPETGLLDWGSGALESYLLHGAR